MVHTQRTDPNRRGAERYPVHANVRVLCADSRTALDARIVNISDSGASVASRVPLKLGEVVYLEVRQFQLYGTAHVSRCTTGSRGYVAALEFVGSLEGAATK